MACAFHCLGQCWGLDWNRRLDRLQRGLPSQILPPEDQHHILNQAQKRQHSSQWQWSTARLVLLHLRRNFRGKKSTEETAEHIKSHCCGDNDQLYPSNTGFSRQYHYTKLPALSGDLPSGFTGQQPEIEYGTTDILNSAPAEFTAEEPEHHTALLLAYGRVKFCLIYSLLNLSWFTLYKREIYAYYCIPIVITVGFLHEKCRFK